jgi:hypothetical protein
MRSSNRRAFFRDVAGAVAGVFSLRWFPRLQQWREFVKEGGATWFDPV